MGGFKHNLPLKGETASGPTEVIIGNPIYYQGTVSAAGVVTNLTEIDGAGNSVIELQHRGTLGQFKFTIVVEGTDDPTATGSEAAGAASTAVGWTALEVRSASGAEMSSIILGGRYLLYNPPRKVRIRCSAYTFGSAQIDVMAKPVSQEDPSKLVSDKDALAHLAMTTFGQMQVAQRTFLAGANFDSASLNTDIWESLNTGSGSHVFANGVIELHTGTSSTGKGGVRSLNLANVLGGSDNAITIRNALGSITDGLYVFRFGVYTALEGTFIQFGGNARTVTDAVFNATTTMTSASGAFTAADLGKRITSSGNVTLGTTIVKIVSATEVLLSAAALVTASAQTVAIEGFGVSYVNRKAGVDTTSSFGIIGFAAVTPSTSLNLWEITFNPNFLIIRNSGNFVQLQIGSTVLNAMFNVYDLPLTAEAINIGSTTDHVLYLQTLSAERLGQESSIRANESFAAEDVLQATATIVHGQKPDGSFSGVGLTAEGGLTTGQIITTDANNTTSSVLAAGATFTGVATDISEYSQVNVSLFARPSTAQGDGSNAQASLFIEFSPNGTNWDISIPFIVRDPGLFIPIPLVNVAKYFRLRYINDGGTASYAILAPQGEVATAAVLQTSFRLTTHLLPNATKELTRTLDQNIGGSDSAALVVSTSVGRQPDGDYVKQKADGLARDRDGVDIETIATLLSGVTYTSGWVDTDGWATAELSVVTGQVGATDGIVVEFTDDVGAGSPSVKTSRRYTFSADDATQGYQTYRFPTELDGFRIKFTNGGTNQTSFYLAVNMRVQSINPQGGVEGSFGNTNTTIMNRGVLVAKNAAGIYANIQRGDLGGLKMDLDPLTGTTQMQQTGVTASASQFAATPLTGRRSIMFLAPTSNTKIIAIGKTNTITLTSNSVPLGPGGSITFDIDDADNNWWVISESGTQRIAWVEIS